MPMNDFVMLSIETHLFFARIMKEHALFLEAGFPCCEQGLIGKAGNFRQKFELLLRDALEIAGGCVEQSVLSSGELVTEFTAAAERKTSALTNIPIDSAITEATCRLRNTCGCRENRSVCQAVLWLNRRALELLCELIRFKEEILCQVKEGRLFTTNYPLLIEHILREAERYRDIVNQLLNNRTVSCRTLYETENFWNRIMMEHAWFIRGLLDPSEAKPIDAADDFSRDYARLLEKGCSQSCRADDMTKAALQETLKYRDFKAAGTKGILDCRISSIILPLLADHVLREANHYIRVLETGRAQ